MPYKYQADKRRNDRRYNQNRIKEANKPAVDLEKKITRMILLRPGKYDVLGLYSVLRKQHIKATSIRQVVDDLCSVGLFRWGPGQRLELTNRAAELLCKKTAKHTKDAAVFHDGCTH